MATWPLVLAGPILRHVSPGSVSVWIALQESRTVQLSVYSGILAASGPDVLFSGPAPIAQASAATRRCGEKLHAVTVTAQLPPTQSLSPGELHCYNLRFSGGPAGDSDLNTLKLLSADNIEGKPNLPLGYEAQFLPGFATCPPALNDLHLVHGSCRLVGDERPDAMPAIDKLVENNRTNPTARPHQLFLTGDQIYADDVPPPVLRSSPTRPSN